jgi:hypothetical protein
MQLPAQRQLFTKNSSWHAKQVNSAYHCHVLRRLRENVRRLRPPRISATKELAVASQQRTVSHFLFNKEFLAKNNMTVVPYPPYFSLFLRLKTKLKAAILEQLK